jgi:hypothetical protein
MKDSNDDRNVEPLGATGGAGAGRRERRCRRRKRDPLGATGGAGAGNVKPAPGRARRKAWSSMT